MNLWRPRIIITAVALVCACIGVQRHYAQVEQMSKNMGLYARVLQAFDDSHTGMMAVDADSNEHDQVISQANEAACDIFGYPKGDLAGQDVGNILPDAFRSQHAAKMKAALDAAKNGRSHVSTMRCIGKRKDGTPVDVYVRVFVTKAGVVALISLTEEMSYTTMGIQGATTLPTPIAP